MDPTAAAGELLSISALDIRAFDVIGWDLTTNISAVPEPSTVFLFVVGAAMLRRYHSRRTSRV